jgi:HD superfamily phosphodiesterase
MDDTSKVIVALSLFGSVTYLIRYIAAQIFSGGDKDAARRPAMSEVTDDRFARLEQAVEAIALEVERISEGQRFTTKLLADRAQADQLRAAPSSEPIRRTTPH